MGQTVGKNADTMTEALRETDATEGSLGRDLLVLVIGVALLIVGANVLVSGATGIAAAFGVSELIVGLTVSVFQAATQINDPSLSFIPKVLAVLVTFALAGPWMLTVMTDYMRRVLTGLPGIIG